MAAEIEDHLMRVAQGDPWLMNHPPTFRWGGRSMIEERGEIFPSLEINQGSDGVKALVSKHREVLNREAEVGMTPTVTDAGWIGRAGIPTVIYGPGELNKAHAVDESIELSELIEYTKVVVAFIADWCNREKA